MSCTMLKKRTRSQQWCDYPIPNSGSGMASYVFAMLSINFKWHTCRRSICTDEFLTGTPVDLTDKIDYYIDLCNQDFRDVVAPVEYPRYTALVIIEIPRWIKRQFYLTDWEEYSNWLRESSKIDEGNDSGRKMTLHGC
jgi:hypothetical protein